MFQIWKEKRIIYLSFICLFTFWTGRTRRRADGGDDAGVPLGVLLGGAGAAALVFGACAVFFGARIIRRVRVGKELFALAVVKGTARVEPFITFDEEVGGPGEGAGERSAGSTESPYRLTYKGFGPSGVEDKCAEVLSLEGRPASASSTVDSAMNWTQSTAPAAKEGLRQRTPEAAPEGSEKKRSSSAASWVIHDVEII